MMTVYMHHTSLQETFRSGTGGPMLQPIGKNIWVEEEPFSFSGIVLGRRMIVIRLEDGNLFLHSPGEMTEDRRRRIESLGRVGYIVAPARFHDLFLDRAVGAFPFSELRAIRPVLSRFSSRPQTFLLSDQTDPSWGEEIEQHDFRARPFHSETVFFHRESRFLLLSDLCFWLSMDSIGLYGTERHEKSPVLRGLDHFTGLFWMVLNHQLGRRQSNKHSISASNNVLVELHF